MNIFFDLFNFYICSYEQDQGLRARQIKVL